MRRAGLSVEGGGFECHDVGLGRFQFMLEGPGLSAASDPIITLMTSVRYVPQECGREVVWVTREDVGDVLG